MPVAVDTETSAVTALLAGMPPGSQGVDSVDRMRAWLGQHLDEYVVVLGPHLDLDDCLKVCEDLRVSRPTVSVVLVRDKLDTGVLGSAMKAGARDVVAVEDTEAVRGAVDRARELWTALRGPSGAQQLGRVVTVFSPKGGVGKTTMAVNLALALTERGARRVCLVDLDLAFGDVAITMQLFPTHSIEHAIGSEDSLDAAHLDTLLTRHADSMMVLAAPAHPDVRERVSPMLVAKVLRTLRETFDFVVVDTAPSFDEQVLTALDETDECVIVATLDVPTLKNVKVALETLDMLDIARGHRHLLLNRADDAVGITGDKVEQILGIPVSASVSSAVEVAAATNAGTPIVVSTPSHQSSQAVRALASEIAGVPLAGPEHDDSDPAPTDSDEHDAAERGPRARPGRRTRRPRRSRPRADRPPNRRTAPEPPRKTRLTSQQGDRIEELKQSVHTELLKQLGPQLYDADMDQDQLDQRVRAVLADVLSAQDRPLSSSDRQRVTQEISDDILGYGPIEPYLRDPDVSEVMVNGHKDIWLERKGKLVPAEATFADEAHLRRTIDKIVSRIGRRVDESSPMVDARLPDGSRVNAVVPPLAVDGSALTIRKFAADPLTALDLISFGSLTPQTCDFLEACVRGRLNVIVSGGTGAGKTTTLNVLSSFIPGDERIVTIEDAAELQLKQDHVVRLESRPANIEGKGAVTIRDLVKNSLRMRPDRVIVGEVRDASALDMLQAMNTGHDGSICTLHSNGPRDTLSRMETMVLMAGMDLPMRAIREQVASAVDLIVHQSRLKDGSRRITHITEVERMEGDVITLQDIFVYDASLGFDADGRSLGRLRPTGLRPKFLEKMAHSNVTVDPMVFATDRM